MAAPLQEPQVDSFEVSLPLACAENIALFHFLHAGQGRDGVLSKDSVPARPSVGPVGGLSTCRKGYDLSLERERSLASTLAFLSSIRDDPDHIPAICIQEDHCSGPEASLRILLAVNKATCKDGDVMLQEVKKGFEGIFAMLSRSVDSDDDRVSLEDQLYRLIVSMCSKRILSRLRFITRKGKTPRQPVKAAFLNVIRALGRRGTMNVSKLATMPVEETALFIERARDIISLIDSWVNHPRIQHLEDLVDGLFRLRQVDCQAVLDSIPNDRLEKDSRKSVLNMILKVARYREAARFLLRTSRKFPIARHMHIVPISLPENVFARTGLNSNDSLGLTQLLLRIGLFKNITQITEQSSRAEILCRLLNTNLKKAEDELTAQTSRTLKTGKIHAEVQLVFYCELADKIKELNKQRMPPRVICSSKKACFLCNMFMIMLGKVHTPWSHGKLYPGWRLPQCSGLDLQSRFNHILELRIKDSIAMLLVRRGKTCYPGPSESTLITLPSLASKSESILNPRRAEETSSGATQALVTEHINENENEEVIVDKGAALMKSKPLPAAVDPRSTNAKITDEANRRAEEDIVFTPSSDDDSEVKGVQPTQNIARGGMASALSTDPLQTPPDIPFPTRMMGKRGSQPTKSVIQPSCGEGAKEADPAQYAAPSNDDINCSNKDYQTAQSQTLSNVPKEEIESPDLLQPSSQSHVPYKESVDPLDENYDMILGEKLSHDIHAEHRSPFYTAGPLELHVEYSTGSDLKTAAGKQVHELSFSIERLSIGEAARLKDHGSVLIVDAVAMTGEISPASHSLDPLYIAAGEVVLKITFHSRPAAVS